MTKPLDVNQLASLLPFQIAALIPLPSSQQASHRTGRRKEGRTMEGTKRFTKAIRPLPPPTDHLETLRRPPLPVQLVGSHSPQPLFFQLLLTKPAFTAAGQCVPRTSDEEGEKTAPQADSPRGHEGSQLTSVWEGLKGLYANS